MTLSELQVEPVTFLTAHYFHLKEYLTNYTYANLESWWKIKDVSLLSQEKHLKLFVCSDKILAFKQKLELLKPYISHSA